LGLPWFAICGQSFSLSYGGDKKSNIFPHYLVSNARNKFNLSNSLSIFCVCNWNIYMYIFVWIFFQCFQWENSNKSEVADGIEWLLSVLGFSGAGRCKHDTCTVFLGTKALTGLYFGCAFTRQGCAIVRTDWTTGWVSRSLASPLPMKRTIYEKPLVQVLLTCHQRNKQLWKIWYIPDLNIYFSPFYVVILLNETKF
jgi:hypothetical protein